MEALIILLAEFLTGIIFPFVILVLELTLFLFTFLLDLILWLFWRKSWSPAAPGTGTPQAKPARKRIAWVPRGQTFGAPRYGKLNLPRLVRVVRVVTLATFVPLIAALLVINVFFLDPVARWVLARAGERTGSELSAQRVSGDIFTGQFVLENLRAHRQSESRTSFDLTARSVSADLDLWSLIVRPITFETLSVEGVSGTMRKPEKRKRARGKGSAGDGDRIKPRRKFVAHELTLRDVAIMLSAGENAPVAVTLKSVRSAPFRSNFALYDGLFRSDATGQIDGRDFFITTQEVPKGQLTRWRIPDLPAATVSRFVTAPPAGWLREGTLNISVYDYWQIAGKAEIDMDWRIQMQGVRAEAREGAGLVESALALPVTRYINSRDGNVDLRFKLVMNESQFENMSSLDARFLWDAVLQSMAKTIGVAVDKKQEDVRESMDKALDRFKGFLDRRRKPPEEAN
jgi:hypothetical protein